MSIESRVITLYCPVCGNDQFSSMDSNIEDLSDAPDDTVLQCADCKAELTKRALIDENQELIDANVEEMTEEVVKDLKKELKKIFR